MPALQPTAIRAQLLYAAAPDLALPALVADLEAAFQSCAEAERRLTWDHDDIALLDIGASRIALGYDAMIEGPYRACLTVAVGYGPGPGGTGIAARRARIAKLLADRIAGRYPPARILWHEARAEVDADLIDAGLAGLAGLETAGGPGAPAAALAVAALPPVPARPAAAPLRLGPEARLPVANAPHQRIAPLPGRIAALRLAVGLSGARLVAALAPRRPAGRAAAAAARPAAVPQRHDPLALLQRIAGAGALPA